MIIELKYSSVIFFKMCTALINLLVVCVCVFHMLSKLNREASSMTACM